MTESANVTMTMDEIEDAMIATEIAHLGEGMCKHTKNDKIRKHFWLQKCC